MGRFGPDSGAFQQVTNPHTGPRGVELRPLGDAVDVKGRGDGRHLAEFAEPDGERSVDQAGDRQVPLAGRVLGHVADVEHREAVGQVLTWWQPRRVVTLGD